MYRKVPRVRIPTHPPFITYRHLVAKQGDSVRSSDLIGSAGVHVRKTCHPEDPFRNGFPCGVPWGKLKMTYPIGTLLEPEVRKFLVDE